MIDAAALCGVSMVVGAMFLLYKGVISLSAPPRASPTELKVFDIIKIKTNVAALCLFAIGYAFLHLGFSHVDDPIAFYVHGQLEGLNAGDQVSVSICGGPWQVNITSDYTFAQMIKPDLDSFQVQIGKIGSLPEKTVALRNEHSHSIKVETGPIFIEEGIAEFGHIRMLSASLPVPKLIDHVDGQPQPEAHYQ
jgi:hypothetical protein